MERYNKSSVSKVFRIASYLHTHSYLDGLDVKKKHTDIVKSELIL